MPRSAESGEGEVRVGLQLAVRGQWRLAVASLQKSAAETRWPWVGERRRSRKTVPYLLSRSLTAEGEVGMAVVQSGCLEGGTKVTLSFTLICLNLTLTPFLSRGLERLKRWKGGGEEEGLRR